MAFSVISCACVQCRLVTSGGDLEGGGMFPLGVVSCTCVQCRLVTSGGDLKGGGMFPLGVVPCLPHRHVEHFCRSSCIPPFSLKI